MIITQFVNHSHAFQRAFIDYGRGDTFTPEGYDALFDYIEDAYGEDYELDVIELCGAYTEYDCLHDYYEAYSNSSRDDCDDHVVAVTRLGTILAEAW
jgi:hypothetical protein